MCFFWCWKNSQSSTVVSLGLTIACGLEEALWGRFDWSSVEIWALEGVWVTSERRHCEARKGVGARGRAKRPGRMRLVGVSEVKCQVTLPWRSSSDLTIMVECICAYDNYLPLCLRCDNIQSRSESLLLCQAKQLWPPQQPPLGRQPG